MIQETIIDPTLNKTRNAVLGTQSEMPYNYVALPAFSPNAPRGQRMQIELRIKTNVLNERLNMQISDEDGERIARMMGDPAFGLRIQPLSLPVEDAE